MRLFVGISLPEDVIAALVEARDEFVRLAPEWAEDKWVPDANLHLTLKFLGDVAPAQVELVSRALDEACDPLPAYRIELAELRAVPSAKRATMVWASAREALERTPLTAALARAIDDALEPLGFEREQRGFKAHVTMVRARSPRRAPLEALETASRLLAARRVSMSVSAATLYASTLGGPAPVYEVLSQARLHGATGSD